MKKLILLLLFIPLVSCDSELTRGETIDKMNRDVKSALPYDFNNGIVWINAINEDNLRAVKIYDVSEYGSTAANGRAGRARDDPMDKFLPL